MSSAGMPTTRMPATAWPTSSVGSAAKARPATAMMPTNANPAVPAAPTMPPSTAAPTEAAAPRITAPIEAGTTPAVAVPAIVSTTEEELSLFHIIWNGSGQETIERQGIGLTNRA
jgi:hypothetical protein